MTCAVVLQRMRVMKLTMVLGAVEETTDVRAWRNPSDTVKRSFAFLSLNGYVLSEVKQVAAGHSNPDVNPTASYLKARGRF
jgi:hypothetical protein